VLESEEPSHIPKEADERLNDAGKGIDDFAASSIRASLRSAIALLPPQRRRHFFIVAGIQISLGLLDLLGIVLVGLVAAIAVTGIDGSPLPSPIADAAEWLGAGNLTVSQLSVYVALIAVFILISKTFLSAVLTRRIMLFLANSQAQLSVRLAKKLLSQPLVVVQRWTMSEAAYALGSGTGAATVALLGSAITIAAETFLFTIVGVSLFIYDPILTIVSLIFFGIIVFLLHRVLGYWAARTGAILRDASIASLTLITEALATFRETTVLNRKDLYLDRYSEITERSARAGALGGYILEVPKYVLEVALYFGIVVLAVVQFLTKDWASAAATSALFLAAGSRLIPALLRLQGAGITIKNASASAQPTFHMAQSLDLMKLTSDNEKEERRVSLRELVERIDQGHDSFRADLNVENVSFSHINAPSPAVNNVSFIAPQGTSVALVGSTGAGKSTLADLIIGALQPSTGEVRIGGVSPREAISRWPGGIAYVPQEVALTTGTVRQNVAIGLPLDAIDDDRVLEALERAQLADFLSSQREGIHTDVGERGFRLSGGQRQRLGIARALYTRPKLLVLDEATSALDAETELAIVAALDALEGHVTTITVAHRLATVRRADLLVYLRDGLIAAKGTFGEVRDQVPDFDRQASLMGL
jgi:ABC-type bacteriocin/lantibiotic exporter with double-glycine peptidase domain